MGALGVAARRFRRLSFVVCRLSRCGEAATDILNSQFSILNLS